MRTLQTISFAFLSAFFLAMPGASAGGANTAIPLEVLREATALAKQCGDLSAGGDDKNADSYCEKALKLLEPYEVRAKIGLYQCYCGVKLGLKEYDKAEPLADEAVRLAGKIEGDKSSFYAVALGIRATVHMSKNQYKQAIPLLERALFLFDENRNADFRLAKYDSGSSRNLMTCYAMLSNEKGARQATIREFRKMGKPDPTEYDLSMSVADGFAQVGNSLYGHEDKQLIRKILENALAIYAPCKNQLPSGPVGPKVKVMTVPYVSIIQAMHNLGEIYQQTGQAAKGKDLIKESADLRASKDQMRETDTR